MTIEEFRALQKPKQPKYHNVKCEYDGIKFDSIAEKDRYVELKLLLQAGEIRGFKRQPSFLFENGTRYRPDFIVCGKDGEIWTEDVKGVETQAFKIKKKLWEHEYPWLELRTVRSKTKGGNTTWLDIT